MGLVIIQSEESLHSVNSMPESPEQISIKFGIVGCTLCAGEICLGSYQVQYNL
jgi:hypothetical protein